MATEKINPQEKSMTDLNRAIPQGAPLAWPQIGNALQEIRDTFGFIPAFVDNLPQQAIPGAWAEIRNLYFNPNTALEPKLKHLIGMAVASQIPCEMANYFERTFCFANGISHQEQAEAVAMAAISRHWSAVLNGSLMDMVAFQKEVGLVMEFSQKMMAQFSVKAPSEEMFCFDPLDSAGVLNDIQNTLGRVPQFFQLFSEEGLAGAWSEFKAVQLSPFTSLTGKEKELIGLAVASQVPCLYCVYFHKQASQLFGATDREMREAISMAAVSRHWSTVFHSGKTNVESFKMDADRMIDGLNKNRLLS